MYEVTIRLRDAQEWADVARWLTEYQESDRAGMFDARKAVILDAVFDQICEQLAYPLPDSEEAEAPDE